MDVRILKGVVSKDHYPPKVSVSDLVKRIKGRSARMLLDEFTELKKRYWAQHLWGIGYGASSTGNITDEMVQQYLGITRIIPIAIRILFLSSLNELWFNVFNAVHSKFK